MKGKLIFIGKTHKKSYEKPNNQNIKGHLEATPILFIRINMHTTVLIALVHKQTIVQKKI